MIKVTTVFGEDVSEFLQIAGVEVAWGRSFDGSADPVLIMSSRHLVSRMVYIDDCASVEDFKKHVGEFLDWAIAQGSDHKRAA